MAMNTKPRLHQSLAFNLIAVLVIGVCFGARPGIAQSLGQWESVTNPLFLSQSIRIHCPRVR